MLHEAATVVGLLAVHESSWMAGVRGCVRGRFPECSILNLHAITLSHVHKVDRTPLQITMHEITASLTNCRNAIVVVCSVTPRSIEADRTVATLAALVGAWCEYSR